MKRQVLIMEIPPSVNKAYSWNKYTNRPHQTKRRSDYIEYVKMMRLVERIEKIGGDVEITVDVFPASDNRDVDNIYKCLFDALQDAGIIDNDKHVRKLRGRMQKPKSGYGKGLIVVEIKQIDYAPITLAEKLTVLKQNGVAQILGFQTLPDKTRKNIEQDVSKKK